MNANLFLKVRVLKMKCFIKISLILILICCSKNDSQKQHNKEKYYNGKDNIFIKGISNSMGRSSYIKPFTDCYQYIVTTKKIDKNIEIPVAIIFWISYESFPVTSTSSDNGEQTLTKINNKRVVVPKDVQAIYALDRNYNLIVIKTTKEEYINIMNEFVINVSGPKDFENGDYFNKLIKKKLNKL